MVIERWDLVSKSHPKDWRTLDRTHDPWYTQQVALFPLCYRKVQVGKDQEKAQSEKDSHSKNQGGKKPN